ncbi:MAG: hypothetical protein WKF82_09995 [Nocardioidaceae bacterium]
MSVIGDPAGMRAAAAQLRWRAERLGLLAGQVDQAVASMTFSGPAADLWRPAVADQSARVRASMARLEQLAETLLREATIVEEQQRREMLPGPETSQ